MSEPKLKGPFNDQACYELGYANPSLPSRVIEWKHIVLTNAYICGQADRQNQAPRNQEYRWDQYDHGTFERRTALDKEKE